MPRNLPFATTFPKYHPRAGEPTGFIEAIYSSIFFILQLPKELETTFNHDLFLNGVAKCTTIRAGNRWKVGDLFTPVVWSGRPYHSKQIKICEPIKIHSVHTFHIDESGYWINGFLVTLKEIKIIALNDGFTDSNDFECWFANVKTFKGQILCWDVDIKYDFLPF